MSFYYARTVILKFFAAKRTIYAAGILGLSLFLITWFRTPAILIFFGIHHVLSEVYIAHATHGDLHKRERYFEIMLRGLFHMFLYLVASDGDMALASYLGSPSIEPLCLLVAALTLVIYSFLMKQSGLSTKSFYDLLSAELLLFISVVLVPANKESIILVLLYHFILWTLVPLRTLAVQGGKKLILRYVRDTGASFVMFALVFAVASVIWRKDPFSILADQGLSALATFGYLHIGLSFAVSRHNPVWVRNLFRATNQG
ncbi:MAG: hypothetical protein EOP06_00615 [Proteobacteria bacterium]|nr:MAG: hypothetical protein EOP06_00615 [Pseudomonadota bacterium]